MNPANDDGAGRDTAPSSTPPHSARVRLEVAFLDADEDASPAPVETHDERVRLTALIVAEEADVRRYVRECLRERADVRVLEAATTDAAIALATSHSPAFIVVDEARADVIDAITGVRAIVIVDDVPHASLASQTHVRLLARPFTAEGLLAEVRQLLG